MTFHIYTGAAVGIAGGILVALGLYRARKKYRLQRPLVKKEEVEEST